MTSAFDAPLNEAFRDAMLALYLHEAVPNDPYLIEQGLTQQIKTANDLYEFWLLDVLISQDVPTSPVACAIASYQQQINSMMLNMEPGTATTVSHPSRSRPGATVSIATRSGPPSSSCITSLTSTLTPRCA